MTQMCVLYGAFGFARGFGLSIASSEASNAVLPCSVGWCNVAKRAKWEHLSIQLVQKLMMFLHLDRMRSAHAIIGIEQSVESSCTNVQRA
jgi:hypothetical protein